MGRLGLTTMLLVILTAATVLAAVSRERLDLGADREADLADAWWALSGERPPAFQE